MNSNTQGFVGPHAARDHIEPSPMRHGSDVAIGDRHDLPRLQGRCVEFGMGFGIALQKWQDSPLEAAKDFGNG